MPGETERGILRVRARRLATLGSSLPEKPQNLVRTIQFTLTGERYAVESRFVVRVARIRSVTPLPGTPDYIIGITFYNGRIYSVVDLKKWFGLPGRNLAEQDPILIVSSDSMETAIIADSIDGERELKPSDIIPMDKSTIEQGTYFHGRTRDGLIFVDLKAVLSSGQKLIV